VFAAGWTLESCEAVCSGDGIDRQDVFDLLQRLVSKSLVLARETSDGIERFGLQETLREYASERLITAGEGEAVQARHADYYISFAKAAYAGLDRGGLDRFTYRPR
jgi:predicted ATPase